MKAIILLTIFVVQSLAFTPVTKEQMRQYYDDCGSEHEVTAERMAQFKSGTVVLDEVTQAFFLCVGHKIGTVDLEDHLVVDQFSQQLHVFNTDKTVEEITAIINGCNQGHEGSADVQTLKAFGCVQQSELNTPSYNEIIA